MNPVSSASATPVASKRPLDYGDQYGQNKRAAIQPELDLEALVAELNQHTQTSGPAPQYDDATSLEKQLEGALASLNAQSGDVPGLQLPGFAVPPQPGLSFPPHSSEYEQQLEAQLNGKIGSMPKQTLSALVEVKKRCLPILDSLSCQILEYLSTGHYQEVLNLVTQKDSERGRAFRMIVDIFEQTKKMYLDSDCPFLSYTPEFMDQRVTLQRANLASWSAAAFGVLEIGFHDLDRWFLQVFVPSNSRLLKPQASVYLELKTQAYISSLSQSQMPPSEVLGQLFPDDFGKVLLESRTDRQTLNQNELDFVSRCNKRKENIEGQTDQLELSKTYQWVFFLRDLSEYLAKHHYSLLPHPAQQLRAAQLQKKQQQEELALAQQLQSRKRHQGEVPGAKPKPQQIPSTGSPGQAPTPAEALPANPQPGPAPALQQLPQHAPQHTPQGPQGPEHAQQQGPQQTPQSVPQHAQQGPQPGPQHLPQHLPQQAPQTPQRVQQGHQHSPHHTPQHAQAQVFPPSFPDLPAMQSLGPGSQAVQSRQALPGQAPKAPPSSTTPHSARVKSARREWGEEAKRAKEKDGKISDADTLALYEAARMTPLGQENTRPPRQSVLTRRAWTHDEERALLMGLDKVQGPYWSQILELYGAGGSESEVLKDRSQVQLKDKARNLKMFFARCEIQMPLVFQYVTGDLNSRKSSGRKVRERKKDQPSMPTASTPARPMPNMISAAPRQGEEDVQQSAEALDRALNMLKGGNSNEDNFHLIQSIGDYMNNQ